MMDEMRNCVLCLMDILGTKGSWIYEEPMKYYNRITENLDYMRTRIEKVQDEFKNDPLFEKPELDILSFSDTIIIILYAPEKMNKKIFKPSLYIRWMAWLLCDFYTKLIDDSLFARGAISHGKLFHKDNIILGPAIDDAAAYYDKANWVGIHCTPTTTYANQSSIGFQKSLSKEMPNYLIDFSVPFKDQRKYSLSALNWPIFYQLLYKQSQKRTEDITIESLELIKDKVCSRYIQQEAIDKYQNMIDFWNHCKKEGPNALGRNHSLY